MLGLNILHLTVLQCQAGLSVKFRMKYFLSFIYLSKFTKSFKDKLYFATLEKKHLKDWVSIKAFNHLVLSAKY